MILPFSPLILPLWTNQYTNQVNNVPIMNPINTTALFLFLGKSETIPIPTLPKTERLTRLQVLYQSRVSKRIGYPCSKHYPAGEKNKNHCGIHVLLPICSAGASRGVPPESPGATAYFWVLAANSPPRLNADE